MADDTMCIAGHSFCRRNGYENRSVEEVKEGGIREESKPQRAQRTQRRREGGKGLPTSFFDVFRRCASTHAVGEPVEPTGFTVCPFDRLRDRRFDTHGE
jgi:hypothetical protein